MSQKFIVTCLNDLWIVLVYPANTNIIELSPIIFLAQIEFERNISIFSSNKFVVQLSRDASTQLKRYLHEQKSSTVIINIINNHIQLDVHDGPGRTLAQVRSTAGGLLGEATRNGISFSF